jgi:peptidoglycan/LPS O-acetylase OafA/YrhL
MTLHQTALPPIAALPEPSITHRIPSLDGLGAIDHPRGRVGNFLNSRFLIHFGVISYSLYLWQQLFLTRLNPLPFDRFPFSLLLAVLAAEASYFIVERPILQWRQRLKLLKG